MKTPHQKLTASVLTAVAFALTALLSHAASVVEFRSVIAEITETPNFDGFGEFSLGITLTPPPQTAGMVVVRVVGGTAKPGEDFRIGPPASFVNGQREIWIRFEPLDDGIPEPDETVNLELDVLEGDAMAAGRRTMTVIIHNRSSVVSIAGAEAFDTITVPEGPSTTVELRRTGDRDKAAIIDVEFFGGRALVGGIPPVLQSRFVPATNRIEFQPGEASRFLPLPLLDNGDVDGPLQIFQPAPYYGFQARIAGRTTGLAASPAEVGVYVVDNERRADEDVTGASSNPFVLFEPKSDVRFIPLLHGRKLAIGGFTRVNGIARPGLCRLTDDDELDESFAPPLDLIVEDRLWWFGFTLGGTARFARFGSPVLVEQAGSILIKTPRMVRVLEDGRIDESFRPPFDSGVAQLAGATNGTLWAVRSNVVFHLSGDGTLLNSNTLNLSEDQIVAVQNDGKVLIRVDEIRGPERDQQSPSLVRWSNEDTLDTTFSPIPLDGDAGILSDGRLIASSDGRIGRYEPNGEPDFSFRPVLFDWPFNGIGSSGVALNMDQMWVRPIGHSDDSPATRFHLVHAPRTALKLWAWSTVDEPRADRSSSSDHVIQILRLGPSTAPATVHYTTRDITATAGKDYEARSGTLTFAPLETDKIVFIPILADSEDEFDETLEVVVTAAEGFEALPAPMRLTILGKGPAPRLDRVKHLRDGRVLIGATGPHATTKLESSTDLKTWHPLTNLLGGFNGTDAVWLDASATNAPTRYYRAVVR